MKIMKNNKQFLVTIPRDMAESMKLQKGDDVAFSFDPMTQSLIVRRK